MSILSRIEARNETYTEWRRDIHKHPEIAFQEHRTAALVAERLEKMDIEVTTGIAGTGVVGKLQCGTGNRAIGLRADLDALPMQEANHFDHASVHDGAHHGCGHDGHTVMLLAAAEHIAERSNFDGTLYFIFQPAEENEGGGRAMVEDGLFERFPMEAVYGMHNWPGLEVGKFAVRNGAMMAAYGNFDIKVSGKGGHGAMPHFAKDPVIAATEIVQAFQTIISRNLDPQSAGVVSVTQINAGSAYNVIPDEATIAGCTRYFSQEDGQRIENRMKQIVEGVCMAHGVTATFEHAERYPVLVNTPEETDFATAIATELVGHDNVNADIKPVMGSEDFAFMLKEKPGCYIFVGNGKGSEGGCMVHHPEYDFNDKVIPLGASYWTELAEKALPLKS